MGSNKKYWKGVEELNQDPEFLKHANKEFPEYLSVKDSPSSSIEEDQGSSRRDFLKVMGFSVAAATLVACEAPVRKAIPYLNKPEEIDPGIANYYASTYAENGDYCSVLVKTREGRPIYIQGNKQSSVTNGGVNARVTASVLDLYNKERIQTPMIKGEKSDWKTLDSEVIQKLNDISSGGGKVAIVSNSKPSPSHWAARKAFAEKYGNIAHITYDVNSLSGLKEANKRTLGKAMVPAYDFSKANVIVGINADFLGTWCAPIEQARQYAKTRKVSKGNSNMSRHYQFETLLSLTGSNADYRIKIKPNDDASVVSALYNAIVNGSKSDIQSLNKVAAELSKNKGKSLVVSGSNNPDVQVMVNAINESLSNYGKTINTSVARFTHQGNDAEMGKFIQEMASGVYAGVIFLNCNPVYDHPMGDKIGSAIRKLQLSVSTSMIDDETTSLCNYKAAGHHYLESWNDSEAISGHFSLGQPAINPLFNTRQTESSLLAWSENSVDYYDYVRNFWKSNVYTNAFGFVSFDTFWDQSLHDGVFELKDDNYVSSLDTEGSEVDMASAVSAAMSSLPKAVSGTELVIYEKINIGSGAQSNNPWLHECPDPITKVCYDNYATVSITMAKENNLKQGDVIKVTANGVSVEVPVLVQPGQANGTVGLAYGYGRSSAGRVGNGIGANAYPMISMNSGFLKLNTTCTLEPTGATYPIAQTQTHQTYMGRDFVLQESTLAEFKKSPETITTHPQIETYEGKKGVDGISLWKGHIYPNHHWGLAIDMNSCTGCSACVVSCFSENNIPMVGKQEVINRREMHWLRIDRYYSSDADTEDRSVEGYSLMEEPSDSPEVVFQPMMCQQCNNAPCETVCPVAATTHSSEGLNQMTYNRCIGTRYCANNCPYKVRRFNWFKYHDNKQFAGNTAMNNDLGKMVLNPDVTVRSRGVMEKCTFCVQRIQAGKLTARKESRKVKDGEITTACASACPTEALVFGDMNDPNSSISQLLNVENKDRSFQALEELRVKPNVTYLAKLRNKDKVEQNNA